MKTGGAAAMQRALAAAPTAGVFAVGPCPPAFLSLSLLKIVFSSFAVICQRVSCVFGLFFRHFFVGRWIAQILSDLCCFTPEKRFHRGVSLNPSEEGSVWEVVLSRKVGMPWPGECSLTEETGVPLPGRDADPYLG